MNDERLENELRRLPVPELPADWRDEILAAARRVEKPRRAEWPPFLLIWRGVFADGRRAGLPLDSYLRAEGDHAG